MKNSFFLTLPELTDMEKLREKWVWIKSKCPKKKSFHQGKLDFQAVLSQNGLICQETVQIYNKNGEEISLDMKLNHVMATENSQFNFIELTMKLIKPISQISFELQINDFETKCKNFWNLNLQNVKNLQDGKSWKLQCHFPEGYFFKLVKITLKFKISPIKVPTICEIQDLVRDEYLRQEYSDFRLVFKNEEFPCHKMIVFPRCQVLADNLNDEFSYEIFGDYEHQTISNALKFLYTDTLEWDDTTCDLLKFAYTYKIQSLKNACIQIMKWKIDLENALEYLCTATLIEDEEMIKDVTEFCLTNRGLIKKSQLWETDLKSNPEFASAFLENAIFSKS